MPGTANSLNIIDPGMVAFDGVSRFYGRTLTAGTGITITNGTGIAGNPTISARDLHTARFIVSPGGSADGANYTTIGSAVAAAALVGGNQTVALQPATYTENFTLPSGVSITAFQANGQSGGGVTIVGKITRNDAGTSVISSCILQTNADYVCSLTGANETNIVFIQCFFVGADHSVFFSDNSNSSSNYTFRNCNGTLNTTGIAWFSSTGSEILTTMNSEFGNSANSTTASTKTAGVVNLNYTRFLSPWSVTAVSGTWTATSIICQNLNQTSLTTATSGTITMYDCVLRSGTASAVSAGAGTTVDVGNATLASTNSNVLTGAGTITITANDNPVSVTNAYNATTITRYPFGEYGTFTPSLTFGGGSTGMTYSTQAGVYNIVGRTVYYQIRITLTAKGSSTGTATVTANLPTPATGTFPASMTAGDITFASGYLVASARNSSGFNILIQNPTSATPIANLTDAAFADTSNFNITGFYFI